MKHVAAYLLAQLGGNASPSESDITGIISSVGADTDNDKLAKLLSALKGKDLVEVLAAGRAKMATMPAGGAAVASSGAPAVGGGDASAPTEQPKAKEPEPEEEEEDMGFDLFD